MLDVPTPKSRIDPHAMPIGLGLCVTRFTALVGGEPAHDRGEYFKTKGGTPLPTRRLSFLV